MSNTSPKEFMKSRRPERFSDSVIIKAAALNRPMLDQYLETLTSRNQENEFAEFARKLCTYEICPNLRPQTGPVGGGDRKVDTETIPVSSQTRLIYYYGQDNQTQDALAFAFSAKKQWSGKARSDVKKIAALNKGYKRAYFVTNQYARDKTSSDIEKELSKECGLQVIILDKNWILDKVFINKREKLVIEEFKMGEGLTEVVEVGPLDLQRARRLQELNVLIEEAARREAITHSILDNAVDAALIAKELDKPRAEVEGLFERAIRMARQYGNEEHLFTALYQKAWATFFWFEDFPNFVGQYDEIEALAIDSCRIYSIERLSNLWSLLRTLHARSEVVSQQLFEKKTKILRDALTEIISDEASPSASVQAEVMLCMRDLLVAMPEKNETVAIQFTKLKEILGRANEFIGFPFETTVQLLTEMDTFFSGMKEFEELQEYVVEIVTKRRGEIPAAELLLQRGIQHLKAKRYYMSIDYLGRSLHRFYKHECRDDLVRALGLLAQAYEEVGLLWAARGALLNAASCATSDFWIYNKINSAQVRCYDQLKHLEVRLGRVGAALDWQATHLPMAMNLANTEDEKEEVLQRSFYFGAILGLLMIKTREEDLKSLEKLPDTLIKMDLDFAGLGLAYRLGGKEGLPESYYEMLHEDPDTFFGYWLTQPAQEKLPDYPDYYLPEDVQLHSHTLGCEFLVNTKKVSPEIEIAEYIIAALESFLATAIQLDAISRDSIAIINVSRDEALGTDVAYNINMDGKLRIDVTCGAFNPHNLSKQEQARIVSKVSEIVLSIVARAIMFKNLEGDLTKLMRDEEVGSRAFNFSSPLIRLGNVFGNSHKRSISGWIDTENKTYQYIPGKFSLVIPQRAPRKNASTLEFSEKQNLTHKDLSVNSVIRMHLWETAGWQGAFYSTSEMGPPIIGLMFNDEKPARAIFKDWRETFGRDDKEDIIHLAIAKGIDAEHPGWYRIGISTKIDLTKPSDGFVMNVIRRHTLTPETTENLDRFIASFKKWGYYLLAPTIVRKGQDIPDVLVDEGIVKHECMKKNAWEVGPNDIDSGLIMAEDVNPVIPDGISNPPILELLKRMKSVPEDK